MDDVSELIQDYLNFDDSIAQEHEDKTVVQEEQMTPTAGSSKMRVLNAITPLVQQELKVFHLSLYRVQVPSLPQSIYILLVQDPSPPVTPEQLADVSLLVKNYMDSSEKRDQDETTAVPGLSVPFTPGGESFISAVPPDLREEAVGQCTTSLSVSMEGKCSVDDCLVLNELTCSLFDLLPFSWL